MIDNLNKECKVCNNGWYTETDLFDDQDKTLHCIHCNDKIHRYSSVFIDQSDRFGKEFDDKINEKYKDMENNTEERVGDKLKFAKLQLPAHIIDSLAEHYGFFDLVETSIMPLYVLNVLAKMEQDGYTYAMFKTDPETGKCKDLYKLDIHDIIAGTRIRLAESLKKESDEKQTQKNVNSVNAS